MEANNMAEKWLDVVKDNLEKRDEVQISLRGRYDKKNGYLVLSKKKALFVAEQGFLSKTTSLSFNDPYTKITAGELSGRHLKLVNSDGTAHTIEMGGAHNAKKRLDDLMKQSTPKSKKSRSG